MSRDMLLDVGFDFILAPKNSEVITLVKKYGAQTMGLFDQHRIADVDDRRLIQ